MKYYIKDKLIYYKKNLDKLNILIEIINKFDNKLNKLSIKIYYNKENSKVNPYFIYISYNNRRLQTNKKYNNNNKIRLIEVILI